jgi:hypothetical protein
MTSERLGQMLQTLGRLFPAGAAPTTSTPWVAELLRRLPAPFDLDESNDLLPWTSWGLNMMLSGDIQRCTASFYAGDRLFPGRTVDGVSVKEYLQDAYVDAWLQIVRRVAGHRNVIGYDLANEPVGIFLTLAATALYFSTGAADQVEGFLTDLLGPETAPQVYAMLTGFGLLPPDASPETQRAWGFDGIDPATALALNFGFDHDCLEPFYARLGQAIQAEDPDAVIWIETSLGVGVVLEGAGPGVMEMNLRRPPGLRQVVFSPHWYTDIYPFPGFGMPPREFTVDEVRFRDYTESLRAQRDKAAHSMGNIPVVFGEFGTYFNFGGIDAARAEDYAVSTSILDNYYESFESLFTGSFLWCFSPENDYRFGEGWNKEDFSIVDPDGRPRGEEAFSRPYPRYVSGKPVSLHFYSDDHYFDPERGEPNPEHEFELRFESKETDAPTEIFVPGFQYPDGFYAWVSDGHAVFDWEDRILYFFPGRDEPGVEHWIRLRPPLPDGEALGWDYFFRDGRVIHAR